MKFLVRTVGLLLIVAPVLFPSSASAQPRRVIAFGDSITVGFGDPGVECFFSEFGGYTRRLETRLRNRGLDARVINRGKCAEQSDSGVTRIDTVLADDNGDVIIIMEGTNDVSKSFISLTSIAFNIDEMARKAVAADVEPVRSTVIPRDPTHVDDMNNVRADALADLIAADAADADEILADPFNVIVGIPNVYTTHYFDKLHPNATGYTLLASILEPPTIGAINRIGDNCSPGSKKLCLREDRFEITVTWRDFQNRTGDGRTVPLTSDTGSFYFFDRDNIELVIKVLDGTTNNGHFWVFYGALSNVEYTITVTDTETGAAKEYFNPLGDFGSVGDTQAFAVPSGGGFTGPSLTAVGSALDVNAPMAKGETCVVDDTHLCLNQNRFRIEVAWEDFRGNTGVGQAIDRTPDTGNFWFFRPENIELIIKVLDGRQNNGHFWVFYGALSNVGYTITVTDTVTGMSKEYVNELGAFGSVGDTRAFEVE